MCGRNVALTKNGPKTCGKTWQSPRTIYPFFFHFSFVMSATIGDEIRKSLPVTNRAYVGCSSAAG